ARGKGFLGALDHAALAAVAPDEREDDRTRDRHGLEPASGRVEIATGLEHLTQKMVGRVEADRPRLQRVHGKVIRPQPRLARAAPERRLVDRRRESPRRRGGQRSGIAGPRDADEVARASPHTGDLEMAPEPREWPIERTREPRHAVLVTGQRGAPPLIRAVEK